MSEHTHAELVALAARWLTRKGCGYVFTEYGHLDEKPDALGFLGPLQTVLVEVKVSRADFRADAKKPWRTEPAKGVGDWRYYMAPRGLLTPADLPPKWGLLEVDDAGRVRQASGPQLKAPSNRNLLSWLRRQQAAGVEPAFMSRNEETVAAVFAWGDELDAMKFEKNSVGELSMLHSALTRLSLKGCWGILKTGVINRVTWQEEAWTPLPDGGWAWMPVQQPPSP